MKVPGHQIIEEMGNNGEVILYRTVRIIDQKRFVAKTTCDEYPPFALAASFQYEYEMFQKLKGKGTAAAYHLEKVGERPVLLLEDMGGITLEQFIHNHTVPIELTDFLRIAVSAADCLSQLHKEHITLNELTPFHFVVNPDTCEVRLTDIRMCSGDGVESPLAQVKSRPIFALPYISPEQTGRTGIIPDDLSDIYSFGVILYEFFSGQLPFESGDKLGTMYHHLASVAYSVHGRSPFIPEIVSEMIGKCMEKMPNARYASAYGIKHDLDECLIRLRASGHIETFKLGEWDVSDRWAFPSTFYGRHEERQSLDEAIHRAAEGSVEIVWVSGSVGSGKTTFVKETLNRENALIGFMAYGKFGPDDEAGPYHSWVQVLDGLVRQLLTESELQLELWKLRIMNAVEAYGQLLIQLIPRLELLIGEQPKVPGLPPFEAQQRFHLIMTRFIKLFLDEEHPLVICLDDLQWSDEASLQVLNYLLGDSGVKNLMLIGIYRGVEVASQHPFYQFMTEQVIQKRKTTSIHLRELTMTDLMELLGDAMHCEQAKTHDLAVELLYKTDGNPFLLKQLLQDMIQEKRMSFDQVSRCWQWELKGISDMSVPNNSAAYLLEKWVHLPNQMIQVLGHAALLGNQVHVDALSSIMECSSARLKEVLDYAVRERLLQSAHENGQNYRFQHDRIQQIAYGLIPESERSGLHLRMGRILLERRKAGEDVSVFEVVHQLNRAIESIDNRDQRLELAELNLQAGLAAKQSTAYERSRVYLRQATELLDGESWNTHYKLAVQAYQERAMAEYLCANFEAANELFDLLLHKAATPLDQARVYILKIQLESNQDNYEEVISMGRKALKLLGIHNVYEAGKIKASLRWIRLRQRLRKHKSESLNLLPPMESEVSKAAMSVLDYTSHAYYTVDPTNWAASVLAMVELTLKEGWTPESSVGFAGYALMLNYVFRDDEAAYYWGMFAYEKSRPYPMLHTKVLSAFSICFDSWRRYNPSLLETFSEHANRVGLESGNLWHSNQSVIVISALLFQYGYPLGDIYDRLLTQASNLRRNNNSLHWKQAVIFSALLAKLTGERNSDDPFIIQDVEMEDFAANVQGDSHHLVRELVYTFDYLTAYLLGNYPAANKALVQARSILDGRRKDISESFICNHYESLVWAELWVDAEPHEQKEYVAKILNRLPLMKAYASRCPENYKDKYLLVKAELARLKGEYKQAEELYEQSIELARHHGHLHDAAMASECYGKYGLRLGKMRHAKVYLTEAYDYYAKWGAKAKTEDLQRRYGHLLQVKRYTDLDQTDYLSVVLSAQALSGEMEMDRLLNALLRIMLQSAGADYGALVFMNQERWVVEGYGTAKETHLESVPLEEAGHIVSTAIIGYAARTKEEVVLYDAAHGGLFMRNPYVKDNELKSVLCLPVMHQNKLICLLYMENKLSAGVFTPERMDVLRILCSQCAISIENARLYSGIQQLKNSLEAQVKERTLRLERSMRETSAALAEKSIYEERSRIAKEIHDIVGHTLTSTILQIEAGKRLLQKDMDSAVEKLQEAQQLVRHSLNEIRGSVHMLKEDKFYQLEQALHQLIRNTEHNTGVTIHAMIHELPNLSIAHKKAIYFALQEGLTNGLRHGGSTEFRFSLVHTEDVLVFRLANNGRSTSDIVKGFGLKAMEERAEQLGGSLSFESGSNQGCLLRIDLPCPKSRVGDRI
ncbi:AAA family ATPase [Paenibacillus dokdonensis]|uniref:AAA family ATPase n=1 Tax=Paenibacillus dokdonensis TaxID=2567944 RepID=UPI001FE30F30|nr:AAA family ATPase [Paenibacillus dokdonensis]